MGYLCPPPMSILCARLAAVFVYLGAWFAHKWDTVIYSGLPMFFWVKPRWRVSQLADQSGKVVLVTGGNSGTGFVTARALYQAGAKVYLACRNESKARDAIREIKEAQRDVPGDEVGSVEFIQLDLGDLESVDRCADEFLQKEMRLDILFANAGIMATPEGLYTTQGYTLQFGTNVLGHHRLITRLLPLLRTTSSSHLSDPARVVLLSSAGHSVAPSGGVDYRSVIRSTESDGAVEIEKVVQCEMFNRHGTANGSGSGNANGDGARVEPKPKRGKYEHMKWVEYGQSKWGDLALAKYLDWTYGPTTDAKNTGGEIISIAVHPGLVSTNLASHLFLTPYILKHAPFLVSLITRPPEDGALNQLWAVTCPVEEARGLSGKYVVPFQRIGQPRLDLEERETVEKLWAWCDAEAKRHL